MLLGVLEKIFGEMSGRRHGQSFQKILMILESKAVVSADLIAEAEVIKHEKEIIIERMSFEDAEDVFKNSILHHPLANGFIFNAEIGVKIGQVEEFSRVDAILKEFPHS